MTHDRLQEDSGDAALDAWLAASVVAPPDSALVERVVASAPLRARPSAGRRWVLPGIGLVGLGLAGSFAGAMAMSVGLRLALPPASSAWIEPGSAFAELPATWSDE